MSEVDYRAAYLAASAEATRLRAEVEALRAELAAHQRTIPALPTDDGGTPIEWGPWEQAPTPVSHIPVDCDQCAHPGPPLLALGRAGGVIRYQAVRCPACQQMRVCRRDHIGLRVHLTEIAYHPPQGGMRA